MNKKGSLFLGMVFAIFFFIIGMLFLPLMKDGVTYARTEVGCSTSSISDGAKLVCLGLDLGVPYFIVIMKHLF